MKNTSLFSSKKITSLLTRWSGLALMVLVACNNPSPGGSTTVSEFGVINDGGSEWVGGNGVTGGGYGETGGDEVDGGGDSVDLDDGSGTNDTGDGFSDNYSAEENGGGAEYIPTENGESPGEGEIATPQASLPAYLIRESQMTAATDENGHIPQIGLEGGVVTDDGSSLEGYTAMVSDEPLDADGVEAALRFLNHQPVKLALNQQRFGSFNQFKLSSLNASPVKALLTNNLKTQLVPIHALALNQIQTQLISDAQPTRKFLAANNSSNNDWCSWEGVSCCEVELDGSYQCYHPGTNSSQLYVYITDGTSLSEPVETEPNPNLLWLNQVPQATAKLGNDSNLNFLGTVGQDNLIQIVEDNGIFMVSGDYEASYSYLEVPHATKIATDGSNLGLLEPDDGVSLFSSATSGSGSWDVRDTGTDVTLDNIKSYTTLKLSKEGKLRFGGEYIVPKFEGKIYDPLNMSSADTIIYLDSDLADSVTGDSVESLRTVAFDSMNDPNFGTATAIVIFQDNTETQAYRMRLVNDYMPYRLGGEVGYDPSLYEFIDLIIDHEQTGGVDPSTESGRVAILDAHNNSVWFKSFFVDSDRPYGDDHFDDSALDVATESVNVGSEPVAMTLNEDKNLLFVLNQGDDSVTVIRTKNYSGNPVAPTSMLRTQIQLRNFIDLGSEIEITPVGLSYSSLDSGEFLLVQLEGVKSNLVIDLNSDEVSLPAVINQRSTTSFSPDRFNSEKGGSDSGSLFERNSRFEFNRQTNTENQETNTEENSRTTDFDLLSSGGGIRVNRSK